MASEAFGLLPGEDGEAADSVGVTLSPTLPIKGEGL